MDVVRWTPFRELETMERRMRRFFDDAGFAPALFPAADVYETEDEFVVELEVPGFEEKELDVELTDHVLAVKGHGTEEKDENGKAYRLRERTERTFERRFELPPEVDATAVRADFEKGILEIRAPKAKAPTPRKIELATKA